MENTINYGRAGIFHKGIYYSEGSKSEGLTIADNISFDYGYISKISNAGFDVGKLRTFLIGGCYSGKSVEAMAAFIGCINPREDCTLIVTDINKEAIRLTQKNPLQVPENVHLHTFQGDLISLGLAAGSVDYTRLDYTQGFIPPSGQLPLFNELKRISSPYGRIASVAELLPGSENPWETLVRFFARYKGTHIDTRDKINGFNMVLLTEEHIKYLAGKSGFKITHREDDYSLNRLHSSKTNFIVYEKA